MSDITEGMGAAIEGALTSRAVEPEHGEGTVAGARASARDGTRESACLNCGADLVGNYCQNCGQKVHVHRTLSAIGHDLLHGVLHLDGKFWSTLPLLAFKPGKLTRRYIEGERAKFVSPMAMFLFSIFAMFAVFQMVGITAPSDIDLSGAVEKTASEVRSEAEIGRAEIQAQLDAMDADDPEREELAAQLAALEAGLNSLGKASDANADESLNMEINPTGFEAFDKGVLQKWNDNPGLMLYKMQANAYKFSWLLIPLSIPFVWLLFAWKRRFKAYDHAIFVTYSLAFMSLLFIALSLLGTAGMPLDCVFVLFAVIAPLHIYKHLRYAYDLRRFSTIWRFLLLMFSVLFVLLFFLQALLILGAF
ncbi:DUF3667 domain-containing protein [Erythrobacter insulae]|uniref:DUF3667 domain-containing protein n=1 Tax=Erythrobacter insulae TaxID=2584124 RepID=A0A547PCC2_9SPHN|nr:DUF3667 domain-containing protein [Erythrobacter insulae]TRD11684.1 DUF3667 domain-containing protein [Erythrobacter insulae]